jgi:hypothetical protein
MSSAAAVSKPRIERLDSTSVRSIALCGSGSFTRGGESACYTGVLMCCMIHVGGSLHNSAGRWLPGSVVRDQIPLRGREQRPGGAFSRWTTARRTSLGLHAACEPASGPRRSTESMPALVITPGASPSVRRSTDSKRRRRDGTSDALARTGIVNRRYAWYNYGWCRRA